MIALLVPLCVVAQFSQADFEKLAALAGIWQMQIKDGFLYEQWEMSDSNLMLSRSFKVTGKDTLALERVRLTFAKGEIFYTPVVPNQNDGKPVPFKLSRIDGSTFYFENKEHDFPQRIIYYLKSASELECLIDGQTTEGYSKQSYNFKKQ